MAMPVIDSTIREPTLPQSTQLLANSNTRHVHFICEPQDVSQSVNQLLGSSEFVSQNATDDATQQLMEAVSRLDFTDLHLKDFKTIGETKKKIPLHTPIPLGLAAGHPHRLAICLDKCMGPQLEDRDNIATVEPAWEKGMWNKVDNHMVMGDAGKKAFAEGFCYFEQLGSNGNVLNQSHQGLTPDVETPEDVFVLGRLLVSQGMFSMPWNARRKCPEGWTTTQFVVVVDLGDPERALWLVLSPDLGTDVEGDKYYGSHLCTAPKTQQS